MTAWIDRTSGEHDELSLKLVELLASLYRRQDDVDEGLQDISGIDLLDVLWPDTFRARRFWTAYVIDLRRANKLRTLLAGLAPKSQPEPSIPTCTATTRDPAAAGTAPRRPCRPSSSVPAPAIRSSIANGCGTTCVYCTPRAIAH